MQFLHRFLVTEIYSYHYYYFFKESDSCNLKNFFICCVCDG